MDVDLTQNLVKLWNEPTGRNAFATYVVACVAGQILNAVWLWLKKEIPCVLDRFRQEPRATIVSIITNLGGIIGVAMLMPWAAMPIEAALVMGVMQGFKSDSAINKNTRVIWSPEERAAAAAKGAAK